MILDIFKNTKGLDQLKTDEGKRLKMYFDTKKIPTIGYGHNLKSIPISDAAATQILKDDIAEAKAGIVRKFPWFKKLNNARKWVIINMVFNLGINNKKTLKRTTDMLNAILNEGSTDYDFQSVANTMLAGAWARQVKGRAKRLAEQMYLGKFAQDYI